MKELILLLRRKYISLLDKKVDLGRLHVAKGAAYNDYENQHTECLPGTRVDLLHNIDIWAKTSNGKCIFWLNGMAGTGKSTISRTVADRLKRQNLLAASFFFKRGEQDRGNAKLLFSTLAKQLGSTIPQLSPSIQRAIEEDPDISERMLREQFEKLILQPLLTNQGPTTTMIIVIDALDECDKEDDIQVILCLLPQVQKSSSTQLRFLLTSRPELPIRQGFTAVVDKYQDLILRKIPEPVIKHDIELYFKKKFAQLRQERSFSPGWPGDAIIRILVDRAVPLFISATTLYRFISDRKRSPETRLRAILSDEKNYASKMDTTYMPVLNQLLTGEDEQETQQLVNEFKNIVGVIILLATPVSVNTLSRLLDMEQTIIRIHLDLLHSVLDVPTKLDEPVRILHLSFRDFLLDNTKKGSRFWINEKEVHQKLTSQCFKIMQHRQCGLKKNICDLKHAGTQRSEIDRYTIAYCLPPDLHYACRYWAHHLLQSHDPANELNHAFSFMKMHFLHWIEAMSILDILSEAVGDIQKLQSAIQNDQNLEALEFFHDAWRFIMKNRQLAEIAPLQLYSSGLMFAPKSSVIRELFESELSTWRQLPTVDMTWGGELLALESHSAYVLSVAFSPDNQLLASSSQDSTIKLWDPNTGELRQTLKGHSASVLSVAFSSDGRLLASGSNDETIELWDPNTGELRHTLKGHCASVLSVAFSSDSQLLASGSQDRTIKLWDPNTGELRQTLNSHPVPFWSPDFSPEDQLLQGHSAPVYSVTFSPDGRLLASSSDDETIKLWDPNTGGLCHTLKGHSACVLSVAFSSDSQLLVSGSKDRVVKLWGLSTGELCQTFKGHSTSILSVAFSSNGQLLASGSQDTTIKLWDPNTGELRQTLNSYPLPLLPVFSPPGPLLKGYIYSVNSVAFSPDGRLLASSYNDTIKLWDLSTAELHQTVKGHSGQIWSVSFSPDGQLLASCSNKRIIKLWDPSTGELRETLKGHSGFVWTGTNTENLSVLENQWIDFQGRRMLWLPTDYRPTCLAFRSGILALGHSSGRVSFVSIFI
ncbi:quinon protein alcohol dehydrogenase-like superfamily [Aspergillus transmontanensis]|uniref:Quinon protein alcohol dehydrogenase-like superfamily n=1 Tax=Aspergillus transmontanensis TaxID=1034304 RepID=A0A5N6VD77_9EURO|nr:quinon protein alcohol dehydrogenase-like superfamily [Aspergillus transmontanensis]